MSTVHKAHQNARRDLRRARLAPDAACHLSGRHILILFSETQHLTDGRDLMDLGHHLAAQGATPIIAGPLGHMSAALERMNCIPVDIPLHRRGLLADRGHRRALAKLMGQMQVSLIHAVGPRAALFGSRLAEASGLPYAASLTHPLSDHFPKEAEALIAAQRIFIANPIFSEEFLDMAPHVEERAQLTPQGVDLDVFTPSAVRAADIVSFVEHWQIPHDKPVLLIKASELGHEVQNLLIQAMVELSPLEFYPVIEVPQGAHKLFDRIERELAKRRLTSEVLVIDALEDPRPLYQISEAVMVDAFAPFSFHLAIAEAGAFGKPVLAPMAEGVTAQVHHDTNGWIFTTQGHQTLKASIAKALTLPLERRKIMQAAAQLHVRTHANAGNICQEVLAAYEALIAADQPFPGVEDMVDFDGDPLEVAAPDARGMALIDKERQARRTLSLRDRSPAVREALQDPEMPSLQSRLAERLQRIADRQEPASAPEREPFTRPALGQGSASAPTQDEQRRRERMRALDARRRNQQPLSQPSQVAQRVAATSAPLPADPAAVPGDVLPAPQVSFSLLDLAKKPGGHGAVSQGAKLAKERQMAERSAPEAATRPAVDVSGTLKSLLNKPGQK